MELDHVLFAVPDLSRAALELETRFGLASIDGGRHPGWGTANRIVPLGDAYLELIAVADRAEASESTLGRWVSARATTDPRPLGWAVRTDDLDSVAARLGLAVTSGSRTRPDGTELRWRTAGVDEAVAEPCSPFFIEWGRGIAHPGRAPAAAGWSVAALRLRGDRERLSTWLGDHELPIVVNPGSPAVVSVELLGSGSTGHIVLGA